MVANPNGGYDASNNAKRIRWTPEPTVLLRRFGKSRCLRVLFENNSYHPTRSTILRHRSILSSVALDLFLILDLLRPLTLPPLVLTKSPYTYPPGLQDQLVTTMPGRILPTILSSDVSSRNTSKSCYVTMGTKLYDITPFLEDHPGGGDLILEYGGKDVSQIMGDEISHTHSESAYEILDEHLVGFVVTQSVMKTVIASDHPDNIVPLPPNKEGLEELEMNDAAESVDSQPVFANTGMSSEADLSRETDTTVDYKTHKFLDLNRPLLMQLWRSGFSKEFYLEQVHRPRHYKGGESAPLFGNFLEPLSKTKWWVVPLVWLPPVAYGTFLGWQNLGNSLQWAAWWLLGVGIWTLLEYVLHRGLFHADK